jgi:hypothetical protein
MTIGKAASVPKSSTPPPPPPPASNHISPLVDPPLVEPPRPLLTENTITVLTEEERAMTVEQWIRHEMDRHYELLKNDGRRKIDAFKERAAEIARHIESL